MLKVHVLWINSNNSKPTDVFTVKLLTLEEETDIKKIFDKLELENFWFHLTIYVLIFFIFNVYCCYKFWSITPKKDKKTSSSKDTEKKKPTDIEANKNDS